MPSLALGRLHLRGRGATVLTETESRDFGLLVHLAGVPPFSLINDPLITVILNNKVGEFKKFLQIIKVNTLFLIEKLCLKF